MSCRVDLLFMTATKESTSGSLIIWGCWMIELCRSFLAAQARCTQTGNTYRSIWIDDRIEQGLDSITLRDR